MKRSHKGSSHEHFDALREQAREAARHGQLDIALALCDEALHWAKAHGERGDSDLALCNRYAILITFERTEGVGSQLRQILMGSSVPMVRFLAAYNLSILHQMEREVERGLFYSKLALDLSSSLEHVDYQASAYHQVGNLMLIDCRFEEACSNFEQALELARPNDDVERGDVERAIILSNAGYCYVMLDRHRLGFSRLFESLRLMRREKANLWETLPHIRLSYAYLDIRKLEPARRHARRALALAELAGCRESIMNSLYLFGEAEKLCGQELAAFECFKRLQREFYPQQPYLVEFLMTTDIRPLIHLMA